MKVAIFQSKIGWLEASDFDKYELIVYRSIVLDTLHTFPFGAKMIRSTVGLRNCQNWLLQSAPSLDDLKRFSQRFVWSSRTQKIFGRTSLQPCNQLRFNAARSITNKWFSILWVDYLQSKIFADAVKSIDARDWIFQSVWRKEEAPFRLILNQYFILWRSIVFCFFIKRRIWIFKNFNIKFFRIFNKNSNYYFEEMKIQSPDSAYLTLLWGLIWSN